MNGNYNHHHPADFLKDKCHCVGDKKHHLLADFLKHEFYDTGNRSRHSIALQVKWLNLSKPNQPCLGVQTISHFQVLFMFHLHNQSPIYLENRFIIDLGITSSTVSCMVLIAVIENYSIDDAVQINFPSRLGFNYTNGTSKAHGNDFSFQCPHCAHSISHLMNLFYKFEKRFQS